MQLVPADGSWEEDLIEDMRVLVIKAMDPFVRVLFALTSKANKARCYALRANTHSKHHGIWRLAMTYSTPPVVQWTMDTWPDIDPSYCTPNFALFAHNFAVAEWLIEKQKFSLGSIYFLWDRDYVVMDWLYDRKLLAITWEDLHDAYFESDPTLIAWAAGKSFISTRASQAQLAVLIKSGALDGQKGFFI